MNDNLRSLSSRLTGKTVIVTGAASGIGAAIATRMALEGAQVVIADLNLDAAQARAAEIGQQGGKSAAMHLDLSQPASIRSLMDGVAQQYGALDVLVNNAANTLLSSTRDAPLEQLNVEVWDQLMHVNLRGTMLAIKYALPHLRIRKGAIVNLASVCGMSGGYTTAYSATKAGVIMLTRDVATQYGKEGIRCNAISPGLIVTPATSAIYAAGKLGEIMLRHHLTPRLGNPDDIAHAAVYLASDEAGFVTGHVMQVDGGQTAHLPFTADFAEMLQAS